MQLQVEDVVVEVQRKDIKNMYLRVDPSSGRVRISAPRAIREERILAFVRQKLAWIRTAQKKWQPPIPRPTAAEETLISFGTSYPLRIREGEGRASLTLSEEAAVLTLKKGSGETEKERVLKAWHRAQLQKQIACLLPMWEARTGLHCRVAHVKDMRTRWGTCNASAGRLWFSLMLAQKPIPCVEYVILHELVHLRVPDHGKDFVATLDRYMPDWRARKALLDGKR